MPGDILTVTLNPAFDCLISVPDLRLGSVDLMGTAELSAAGKGVNVCRALHSLNHRARHVTILGERNAESFVAQLEHLHGLFLQVPGNTRTNYTLYDPHRNQRTHVRTRGAMEAGRAIPALLDLMSSLSFEDTIVFSGSCPTDGQVEEWTEVVAAAMRSTPNVIVDGSGPFLMAVSKLRPLIVKPNFAELEQWAGQELRTEAATMEAAKEMQRLTGGTVLLTLGASGSICIGPKHSVLSAIPSSAGRSPHRGVGCGDAFLAGIVASKIELQDVPDGLRLATGAALAARSSAIPCTFVLSEALREAGACRITEGWDALSTFFHHSDTPMTLQ